MTQAIFEEAITDMKGLTAAGAAEGHQKDLAVQGKHGVEYLHYWLNEADGTVFWR